MSDGGPAFPRPDVVGEESVCKWESGDAGMSLRDWFAGQAIVGLAVTSRSDGGVPGHNMKQTDKYAQRAYAIADAMLKAR